MYLVLDGSVLESDINSRNASGLQYKCAGNALMSLERYDEAIKNYGLAVKYEPNNGNRYYDLDFTLATNEKLADAIKNK